MRKTVFYSLTAVFLLAAAVWAAPQTTAASDTGNKILTITPATTKPMIQPGATASGKFQIINQGTGDYPARIYAAPYTVHSEDYTPDFTPVPGKPNASNWLHFAVSQANIAANQTVDINYTVTVPAGTTPGGYYAVAFAETQSKATGQGVVVNERVGEIFYIQVAGKVRKSGKLLSWSSSFLQKQPLGATLRLENDGSLDYASNIHITASDLFGRAKYTLATTKEVLPQTIRRIPFSWTGAPPLGLFKVTGTATLPNNQTVNLSTHYVLVASPTVRLIGAGLVVVVLAYCAGQLLGSYRRRAKNTKD